MPLQAELCRLEFAQKSKLTELLHQLIRSYPKGVGIIHEFIQNADDAGASTVSIALDERQHPDTRLPSAAMRVLQGPALVVQNDATFSEDDWERIQSTGRSGKLLDASKTGRFGLGFNSVYNVTDWPCVLTRNRIGIFDPHGETVAGSSRDTPGSAWELTEGLWQQCGDLLAPFEEFGLPDRASEIGHTIFRLPLRTENVADKSEICNQAFTRENFDSLVRKLVDEAGELLLFLKNLNSVIVRLISEDGQIYDLLSIRTLNVDAVAEARALVHGRLRANHSDVLVMLRGTESNELVSEYEHHVIIERPGVEPIRQSWAVVQALVAGENDDLLQISKQMFDYEEKAVPLVGAAALVNSTEEHRIENGRLFCTLPLSSVSSYLPFHINGFFDLQSDRQGLFADQGAEGKAAVRVDWNRALLQHGCAQAAARLLAKIATGMVQADDLYGFWPASHDDEQTMLQSLPRYVYEHLRGYKCMPCGSDQRLVTPQSVHLLPHKEVVVRQVLLAEDLPLADPVPPKHVSYGFKAIMSPLNILTPKDVRDELRVVSDPACKIEDAPRIAIRSEEWICQLLRFCCRDNDIADLAGVPLSITLDGRLHAFKLCDEPLLIATETERRLLADVPGLLLDNRIVATQGFGEAKEAGIERVTPNRLISLLPRFLGKLERGARIAWKSDVDGIPTEEWLTEFYSYLADHAEHCALSSDELLTAPLVPDQFGFLWSMGLVSTPLLPSDRAQTRLVNALKPFRVPVVDAPEGLLNEIRRLVGNRPDEAIWRITGRDLIDTIAAVKEEWEPATQTFSSDIHGVLLSFLATTEALRGVKEKAAKLKELPIFPASDRSLVTLDSQDVYLPAGFILPQITSGLGILYVGPDGKWLPLFEALKVRSLSRANFIREVFLPRYGELTGNEQMELLQWLRTHLEEAYNELGESEGRELHADLIEAELVVCTDGKRHSGRSLYHPDEEEPFGSMLGEGAGFPDMTVYSSRQDSWLRMFEQLGMETRPRAKDLLTAIDEAVACHPSDPVKATASLSKIVDYVQRNWSDLRDVTVADDLLHPPARAGGTLLEALSVRVWLPVQHQAPRGFPRELFAQNTPRLSRPDGLYGRDQLDLVSLVAPLSQFDLGIIGNDIGVQYSTDLETLLNQLRAVIAVIRQDVGQPTIRKRTVLLFTNIYRRLGQLFTTSTDHDNDDLATLAVIRKEFADIACVVDEDDVLWKPARVFASSVHFFVGRRAQVRSRNDLIERGLDVLGRRRAPSAVDFFEFFNELSAEQAGRPVDQSLRPQLQEAYRHAAKIDDAEGVLHSTCVLTEDGLLESSNDVVIDDADWLSERAMRAGLLILDRQLDLRVAHSFGVTALSKAVYERRSRVTENRNATFATDCDAISVVVRSAPFVQGLMRLIAGAGFSVRGGDLDWLASLEIRPVGKLFSELVWRDGHESIDGSEGDGDVLFDPERTEIIASADASDVLYERVASVIAHELAADSYSLNDLSPIAAMLRSEPSRIQSLLTRLRVPNLIDDKGVFDEDGGQGGFIDDDSGRERNFFDDAPADSGGSGGDDSSDGETESRECAAADDAGPTVLTADRASRHGNGKQKLGRIRHITEDVHKEDRKGSMNRGPETGERGEGQSITGFDGRLGKGLSDATGDGRPNPGSRCSRSRGRSRRAVTYVHTDGYDAREQSRDVTE